MANDPFAPIGGGRPAFHVVDAAEWETVAPVPADAPKPPTSHPKLGKPTATWTYLDEAGALLGYAMRFDTAGGEKEFRPLALWRSTKTGGHDWRWAAWSAPRPLYGLDRLAARPDAPVIVCEGEKAADAAGRLAPEYVAITSPNGSKSAGKADWNPLKGRGVVIWPDADAPGAAYASEVARLCNHTGAQSVAILEHPEGLPDGFDAADAEAEGWGVERLAGLIAAARPVEAAPRPAAKRGRKPKDRTEEDGKRAKRGGAAVVELIEQAGCEFWHSPEKVAFVTFPVNDHWENWRVGSKEFARWVLARAYKALDMLPAKSAVDDAIRLFEARAVNEGPMRSPWMRSGDEAGAWWIDVGDASWRAIRVADNTYQVVEKHGCAMIRSPAMVALPLPMVGGDGLARFKKYVNADDAGFRLILSWMLAAMWPKGPYPILLLNGEQGSAKSTISRLLRCVIDPNVAPLRAMPQNETDLIVSGRNGHVIAIDNVSSISNEMSDALCRVATGGGFSARAKFSDGDEFVTFVKNPIIMNGIPSLANRPDLASRAIAVRLEPIADDARRTEEEQEAQWSEDAPVILHAMLIVLALAKANLANVKLPRLSRMADFERLVEAGSAALELEPGEFSKIIRENREELDASAIESDAVASAVLTMLDRDEHRNGWSGKPTRLLELLCDCVQDPIRRSRAWPASAAGLSNRLERCKPLLRRHGVTIQRKHSGERTITISVDRSEGR
jgi:hypothetical protein